MSIIKIINFNIVSCSESNLNCFYCVVLQFLSYIVLEKSAGFVCGEFVLLKYVFLNFVG